VGFSLVPTGELFVAGTACDRSLHGALVEIWPPGVAVSRVVNLERDEPVTLSSIAASPAATASEVLVGGCLRDTLPFLHWSRAGESRLRPRPLSASTNSL
jgi:hypothetical protein